MSKRKSQSQSNCVNSWKNSPFSFEPLEDRRLLSASLHHSSSISARGAAVGSTIKFSQAPAAVKTGLDSLATADGQTAPAADSTQTVYLGNSNGVETYSLHLSSTGTRSVLTVDQTGAPVTVPTQTTTTFGDLSGTAAGTEISAIASALGLTTPADTASVSVSTPSSGTAVYTIRLSGPTTTTSTSTSTSSTTGTARLRGGATISVDANGNPVGNESIPFTALPAAIQNGFNNNVPTGDTALATTSTQSVRVRTTNGVTTYALTFATTGTVVTLDTAGNVTTLPSTTTDQFQNIPAAAQTELQSLATAAGVTDTIATTQSVTAYDEANGTTIYSVRLSSTVTASDGSTHTRLISLAVDENGNPTVPPSPSASSLGGVCGGGSFGGGSFGGGGGIGSFSGFGSTARRR